MTLLPPPQYDVPPPMPVIERVLPWSEVQTTCFDLVAKNNSVVQAQADRQRGWNGCSAISKDGSRCYIWRTDSEATARHERAHCAGWPADHPGGR